MQTLRKKTSPLKYKNETTRFLGDGVSFKAKLIGILEVSEARGDRMCQEALSDLKMAIRAAGEHKQRITINIAIDGLRLRDEKTGDSLYHHPVHKISFIAQDMTDSRAFGYIFGSPDTGHRFFGIKTDKAASQVVIAMRDLFQVVFALKKKEIELAKQHLDKTRFTSSPLFSESSVSNTKLQPVAQESAKSVATDSKAGSNADAKSGGTAVADLVDLELELNSLQQGLNQMERITPSDPFGSKDDPFGDSFISYTRPILPPPPSSGRERSSRTSETSAVFSPRTHSLGSSDASCDSSLFSSKEGKGKKEFFPHDMSKTHQESISEDWFSQNKTKSVFEKPPLVPEPTKDEKHEMTKQEILSQFDVFTELDPLGTGKSKPYIDKKHFFQELKNPPKKVLNDLVSQAQQQETNLFNRNPTITKGTTHLNEFNTDPFGEDPFVTEDPFAEADFSKQDPFESEFAGFKAKPLKSNDFDNFKLDSSSQNENQINLSKSPRDSLEKQISVICSTSPKTVYFDKQNTFGIQFDNKLKHDNKLIRLHENVSLDISSESECAPEPPPRPESTFMQIKPPPLPPKKQGNEFSVRPPPRPPHIEESHYDSIDDYETASNSLEFIKKFEKSPPIPVPSRKSKFEPEYGTVPERPKKHFNVHSSEEDYLTPISFVDQNIPPQDIAKSPIMLPPPQRSLKKQNLAQTTLTSLESRRNITTTSAPTDNLPSLEGLDISLSQLTLSGLNELAAKLNIPTNQLSNMTLVQLTNYLSNFIKSKTNHETTLNLETNSNNTMPTFNADFTANFNNLNSNTTIETAESYDRYAVFRELMNEEIKQTRIDTEPEELKEEKANLACPEDSDIDNSFGPIDNSTTKDKYAALREIVESEIKLSETECKDDNKNDNDQNVLNEEVIKDQDETNINIENKFISEEKEKPISPNFNLIEYNTSAENKEVKMSTDSLKSPKSPVSKVTKSPVPLAITEIMNNSARLNSGSLSDVVSGSSPEVDNTGSNSEFGKKTEDAAGESWAIFDQGIPVESVKEKQAVQSEEGVSPWSSDSKEFGNGSPPEWRPGDSESGGDQWTKRRGRRDQEGWWDTSAEPEVQYYPNRRSTDSYDDEYYESYERPRRRKQAGYAHSGPGAGGHSSSSRDVSPWEEEPRRREQRVGWMKHARQHSFEKYRERRHVDSWDDEDDYEYEEDHAPRFHRPDRQKWEMERERYNTGSREHDIDKWEDDWNEDRRHRRRRDAERERRCCPDWDLNEHEKSTSRYPAGRWSNVEGPPGSWRDRKHDERYYSRESQESPWEDDYSNEAEEISTPHYPPAKRNWKRPSSASEMDRKTGEIKSRHYLVSGGSDGERDRRYKPGRRSRSRDSQYSEGPYRHKNDTSPSTRGLYRSKQYLKQQFDGDFTEMPPKKQAESSKLDHSNKKSATLASRKKTKDSPKSEINIVATFPRKSSARAKSLFENDFVPSEDSPVNVRAETKFNFENDFETSEAESPTVVTSSLQVTKQQSIFEKSELGNEFSKESNRQRPLKEFRLSPSLRNKSKSLFEDDFSPTGKSDPLPEDNSISSIKEESDPNDKDIFFRTNNLESTTNSRKKKIHKHRLSSSIQSDINIKKSESVNIFARESDPFDDDFFSENVDAERSRDPSLKTTDLKWTDDFEDFDKEKQKNT